MFGSENTNLVIQCLCDCLGLSPSNSVSVHRIRHMLPINADADDGWWATTSRYEPERRSVGQPKSKEDG